MVLSFQYAVKTIDISDHKRKDHLLMEIMVMRELTHPNLVNYVDLFLESLSLKMVMELMDGGALTDVVLYTILSERQIAAVTKVDKDNYCQLLAKSWP